MMMPSPALVGLRKLFEVSERDMERRGLSTATLKYLIDGVLWPVTASWSVGVVGSALRQESPSSNSVGIPGVSLAGMMVHLTNEDSHYGILVWIDEVSKYSAFSANPKKSGPGVKNVNEWCDSALWQKNNLNSNNLFSTCILRSEDDKCLFAHFLCQQVTCRLTGAINVTSGISGSKELGQTIHSPSDEGVTE
ncbi:hypothetical protein Pcinc_012784 [Petrolisthes cinctipes]|uniref:Uncharacterized protein n=1 Tax=Petrolisthes cinctipes TaxID=88211 RepID=A0AAE1FZY6_PETCI|nr:hypothetical protein Pcinc_012784 [Petrolisthes cinctipes]